MNLHFYDEDFNDLAILASNHFNITVDNIKRDYFIVLMLKNLSQSEYLTQCVFKGGTSLSKCYPGSINRFSEDIDLTLTPNDAYSKNKYDKELSKLEQIITSGFNFLKIDMERNQRNKSSWVWFKDENLKIKLEIGSSIRPDPYHISEIKSYIQEYLEENNRFDVCDKFNLTSISINVLDIDRTFLDKIMAVKRHALCGSLKNKVRHIYDVVMLYKRSDIKEFLNDKDKLKQLLQITKNTDDFYVNKRLAYDNYNALGPYGFEKWVEKFDSEVKKRYLSLPQELLFSKNIILNFNDVISTFEEINNIFKSINE